MKLIDTDIAIDHFHYPPFTPTPATYPVTKTATDQRGYGRDAQCDMLTETRRTA